MVRVAVITLWPRRDSPGVGNQGSSGTGNPLCHGNEGLLYLRVHLGVPSQAEEVTAIGPHVSCSSQQLCSVLKERKGEREGR